MTCRWFLEELAEELGEVPYFRASDIFKQCVKQLKERPRLIIVDEIDYLVSDNMAIETLRDILDKTDVPIILIGMNKVDKKLLRQSHLYDRISKKLKFIPFSENDVTQIVKQLCEIEITEGAAKYIYSQANRLRQIVKIINTAENFCQTNGLKIIDEKILQEVIKNETEIIKTC